MNDIHITRLNLNTGKNIAITFPSGFHVSARYYVKEDKWCVSVGHFRKEDWHYSDVGWGPNGRHEAFLKVRGVIESPWAETWSPVYKDGQQLHKWDVLNLLTMEIKALQTDNREEAEKLAFELNEVERKTNEP